MPQLCINHGCCLSSCFNYSNVLILFFGSSWLVSLQYIGFVTLPPHKPWLRPSQAKARPKPTSMAWPEDPRSQSHSKPSQSHWLPGQAKPAHHYSQVSSGSHVGAIAGADWLVGCLLAITGIMIYNRHCRDVRRKMTLQFMMKKGPRSVKMVDITKDVVPSLCSCLSHACKRGPVYVLFARKHVFVRAGCVP